MDTQRVNTANVMRVSKFLTFDMQAQAGRQAGRLTVVAAVAFVVASQVPK